MGEQVFTELTTRALVRVSGDDAAKFLHGLVTCDVTHLKPGEATFGALLSPQGKILFDFFIIASTNGFILDVDKSMSEDFIRRLIFYRLRAKITIEPMDERAHVFAIWGKNAEPPLADGVICADPRLNTMGYRAYIRRQPEGSKAKSLKDWHKHRIALGMPEGGLDYAFGAAFPHECLMDQFKGVDFTKGCYVGQEVVSRMQHRGTARKQIIHISAEGDLPSQGSEVLSNNKSCGEITSIAGKQGLAMVRLDRVEGIGATRSGIAGSTTIKLKIPNWCRFGWPDSSPVASES